jgi:hypothetical protein
VVVNFWLNRKGREKRKGISRTCPAAGGKGAKESRVRLNYNPSIVFLLAPTPPWVLSAKNAKAVASSRNPAAACGFLCALPRFVTPEAWEQNKKHEGKKYSSGDLFFAFPLRLSRLLRDKCVKCLCVLRVLCGSTKIHHHGSFTKEGNATPNEPETTDLKPETSHQIMRKNTFASKEAILLSIDERVAGSAFCKAAGLPGGGDTGAMEPGVACCGSCGCNGVLFAGGDKLFLSAGGKAVWMEDAGWGDGAVDGGLLRSTVAVEE